MSGPWPETRECKQCLTPCTEARLCRCCVARLRDRAEAAEAEVERLTAGIAAALALIEAHWVSQDVIPDLGGIEAVLRGES